MRLLVLFFALTRVAPLLEAGCFPVHGESLLGRDLAAAVLELSRIPPDTVIARAPQPGARRIFHASELQALAHRFSLDLASVEDVCFEWPMAPLDREQVLAAMRDALALPDARIEVGETGPAGVPPGRLEFKPARLGTPAIDGREVIWRGDVVYGEGLRFAVWASVRIAVPCEKVYAVQALRAGQPIQPQQVRTAAAECFPDGGQANPAGPVAGMIPLHPIAPGSEIHWRWLLAPNAITRGETTEIEVRSGAARLAFTARAEANGKTGEVVPFRNPASNRTFEARVTGRGKAAIVLGSPENN